MPAPDLWSEVTQRAARNSRAAPRSSLPMNRFGLLAVGGMAVVVASLLGIALMSRRPNVGPPSTSTPTAVATPAQASPLTDGAPGVWRSTGSMTMGREGHTATLLLDGRVLVVAGDANRGSDYGNLGRSAETYDPATEAWTVTGPLATPRVGHTATRLKDGRVLVAGGQSGEEALTSAELYDPTSGTWTVTASMVVGHGRGHVAVLLPDGKVLIAGGFGGPGAAEMLDSAEVYDPATGSWTSAGRMSRARTYFTATVLHDGMVLVAGGLHSSPSAELYDPATGAWRPTGSMIHGRHDFTATLLADGRVLVTEYEGGTSAELYDPGTGTWSATGSMVDLRLGAHEATLLPDGRVVVVGHVLNGPVRAEIWDPQTDRWMAAPPLLGKYGRHVTVTLLADGSVLVAGGPSGSAERYIPGAEQSE